jgi:hypothetical protein
VQSVPDVNAIMEALKALLATVPGVKLVTRIWQPWEQLADLSQPCIVIVEKSEDEKNRRGQSSAIDLKITLVLYEIGDNQNLTDPPAAVLNRLIQGVRTALLPTGSDVTRNAQTLGGLVSNCAVVGTILKDAGVLDNQMSASFPVLITIP